MDPNTTLSELRDLVARRFALSDLEAEGGDVSMEDLADMGYELAETFAGLDTWLATGGFLPDEWRHDA